MILLQINKIDVVKCGSRNCSAFHLIPIFLWEIGNRSAIIRHICYRILNA